MSDMLFSLLQDEPLDCKQDVPVAPADTSCEYSYIIYFPSSCVILNIAYRIILIDQ